MAMSNPSILLVDDEFQVLEMLRKWLEEQNYQVTTAATAEGALELFYELRPTLSIVDLRMPGMNGFQLIRRIRELSEAPVMVLSALSEDADQVRVWMLVQMSMSSSRCHESLSSPESARS